MTADQALTVSAQFAKRLGDHFVVSAGIVEGKGGAGAELRLLDDRLRFGALAYDFTKRDDKPNPRYRATASYQLWKGSTCRVAVRTWATGTFDLLLWRRHSLEGRGPEEAGGPRWSSQVSRRAAA